MTPHKFIPPKDREEDFNEEIDRMIEERMEMDLSFIHDFEIMDTEDDADDLSLINIG